MLYVKGFIQKRTRRTLNFGGEDILKVTYQLSNQDEESMLVTHINPDKPYELTGEIIELPVKVRSFNTKKGLASYELSIDDGNFLGGEEF